MFFKFKTVYTIVLLCRHHSYMKVKEIKCLVFASLSLSNVAASVIAGWPLNKEL